MASIKVRTKRFDDKTHVRILIVYPPSQPEINQDQQATSLTATAGNYIKELTIKYNDNDVVTSSMADDIAPAPYFAFMLKGGKKGEFLTVSWVDNLGKSDTVEVKIT